MGIKRCRAIWWLSLLAAVLILLLLGNRFCFRNMDHDQRRIEGFYMEPKDSLDVVFMGSSEIFSDFSSAQAYEEFGFTSYPYAVNANPVTLWKYELKEIIDRQHPQLVVVETNGALYNSKRLFREVSVRRISDNSPMTDNIKGMIREYGCDDWISYCFPFVKYHNNWEHPELMLKGGKNTASLYFRGSAYLKGISTNTKKLKADKTRDIRGDTQTEALNENAEEALRDFLEYCRDEKIDNIIFVRYPHCIITDDTDYSRFMRSNAAGEIIMSYGFDFINLDQQEEAMGLDLADDFYNSEHMNVHGMKKMTSWFGRYLMDHYHLVPRQQAEKNKTQWDQSVLYTNALYDYFDRIRTATEEYGLEINETAQVMQELKKMLNK